MNQLCAAVDIRDDDGSRSPVAPVPDVDSVVGELVVRVSGLGPLQPFLEDPAVEVMQARQGVPT